MTVIYSARWLLPVASPMIENGALAIDGSTIVAVGPRGEIVSAFPNSPIEDFGQAAILPGLINVHSHLELTVMRGFLEREESDFFAWLKKLTTARLAMTPEDLIVSATCGAIEAARSGVTSVGDSSSSGVQTMQALRHVGVRGIVYQESFGPDPKRAAENVAQLCDQIGGMREYENDLLRVGVSPHAPYTVSATQLEMISRLAVDEKLPLMMHAAESQAEKLLLLEGRGAFAEGFKKRAIDWKAPRISTIAYLQRHGVLETKPLLAHCINVDDTDLDLIKQSGTAIAHCPKSNAKLGHGCAPLAQLVLRAITVGLGSDSVASNNTCDILEEARFATLIARLDWSSSPRVSKSPGAFDLGDGIGAFPNGRANAPVSAEQTLFAATLDGARALRIDDRVGALAEGMQADIAVVDLSGAHQQPISNPADALVFSSSGQDVLLTMVAGDEIYRDRRVRTASEEESRTRLEEIRSRLEGA